MTGFVVPRCAVCGHTPGDHPSNTRGMNPLAPRRGAPCRAPGCNCQRWIELATTTATEREAA